MAKKYTARILIALKPEQKKEIAAVAAAHSQGTSEFIRSVLHRYCGHYRKKEEAKRVEKLYGEPGEGGGV
jgi:hypothetical protein